MKDMIACEECDALNPTGTAFCAECGVKLVVRRSAPAVAESAAAPPKSGESDKGGGPEPPPLPGERPSPRRRQAASSRRSKPSRDSVERSRARHEFGRIKNIVFTVRSVYWAGVAFAVVQLLLHYVVVSVLIEQMFDGREAWRSTVSAMIAWAQLALMLAGALLVVRMPLVWTVVGACYWTLNTVMMLLACAETDWVLMQDARAMAFVTMLVFMVVCFWFAVAQAARVQRLMQEHPELQIVRKRLDPEARVVGGVAEEARLRRSEAKRRELIGKLRMAGIVVAGMFVVGVVVWFVTRPPGAGEIVGRFVERWAAADVEGLGDLFLEGRVGRAAERLEKGLGQRGWSQALPRLGEVSIDEAEDRAVARIPCGSDEIEVEVSREPVGWRVVAVDLPPLTVGDIEPAITAFRAAWNSPGTDALTALIRPENRDRVGRMLVRALEGRSWDQTRPELGEVDPGRPGRPRVRVLFACGFDELSVVLEYWHPDWWLSSMRLPRE